ncbi:DNA repair protein RAD51 homolog 4 [Manduca sexta]|uniref:DNA repair protein RAD51 homolog 4 n=1 Tax=Manduca sexta TaxID=7130 RepID=UPI00188EC083|nr:DNA repair protein RAD51 homolog 4 [Manduca sexta]
MQKLKSGEFTDLSEPVLKTLNQNRINTISEFLQEDVSKLSTLTNLNLSQIVNMRNEIFAKYCPPLINGTTILAKSLTNKKNVTCGIERLDALTGGGIPTGTITELCGLADSGKTQLCFQIAINCAKNTDNTVLYLDTKGDFSAVRIQKILEGLKYSHKDMALIMYRIRVIHIWTMEELVELFKNLNNKTLAIENLALIIIDSLPCLMFQYLGDDNKIGLTHLNEFVNKGRCLCRTLNVALLCVNIQTRWVDPDVVDVEDEETSSAFKDSYIEKRIRCLGKYWQEIPALVLVIERIQENNDESQLKIIVTKFNNASYENQQCLLNLNAFGVT